MLTKIKNIDPKKILVAKVVAVRIVLPIAAVIITQAVVNHIEKKQEETEN